MTAPEQQDTTMAAPATAPLSFVGFEHDREIPREWIHELRRISPKSDDTGWLYLHWEAGDPWVPGQRLVLYEMLHEKFVDVDTLEELNGPHPRSEGHMCATNVPQQFQCLCPRKLEGWRGGPCQLVTLPEWKIYRATGYVARPFWIIQGSNGGHKWHFNKYDEILARSANLPSRPPAIGSLPYAPFDARVTKQIIRHNRLMRLGMTLDEFKRTMGSTDLYAQYKANLERQMRAEYIDYLAEQMKEVNDLFISAADKGEMDTQRKTRVDWERVEAVSTPHYVETGNVLHPAQIKGAISA